VMERRPASRQGECAGPDPRRNRIGQGSDCARPSTPRRGAPAAPSIASNCGAIPSELVDSELFGHEKERSRRNRTPPGMVRARRRRFAVARRGGRAAVGGAGASAARRAGRSLRARGGQRHGTVDVRIIAATHRDLPTMVAERTFRRISGTARGISDPSAGDP